MKSLCCISYILYVNADFANISSRKMDLCRMNLCILILNQLI